MTSHLRPIVIAHRTCPLDAPENSLEGIAEARRQGADMVEIDVRPDWNGRAFLMHDRTPHRTTGALRWPLAFSSLRRVRNLHLSNGSSIPSLGQALDALSDDLRVAIEVKGHYCSADVINTVRAAGMEDRVLIWSFSERTVRYFVKHAPEMEISLLRTTHSDAQHAKFLRDAKALGADGVSIVWDGVTEEFAAMAKQLGLVMYSYVKERTPDMARVQLLDGLITDFPAVEVARRAIASRGGGDGAALN